MKTVAIVQRVLPHYRLPFFQRLQAALAADGVALQLYYGQNTPGAVPETVALDAPWAQPIENRFFSLRGRQLIWQHLPLRIATVDLVIVEQASRLLVNYALLAQRVVRARPRFAYWGHGRNYQAERPRLSEAVKRRLARMPDWWFAYTGASAEDVRRTGFPPERITVVDNSLDSEAFAAALAAVDPAAQQALRQALGLTPRSRVGLYCGGLQVAKRLPFLLEAAARMHARNPEFHLVVIGDGPDGHLVEAAAAEHPWIHDIGAAFGPSRAQYFALADVLLMPANLGLVAIDSFIAACPIVTTDHPTHGPEYSYLQSGQNALVTPSAVADYADAASALLEDPATLARLQAGCRESAARYSLANMVANFRGGVLASLR